VCVDDNIFQGLSPGARKDFESGDGTELGKNGRRGKIQALHQLETDNVKEPSPNILYVLANVYGASYGDLMQLAGFIVPSANQRAAIRIPFRSMPWHSPKMKKRKYWILWNSCARKKEESGSL
jgi:hypothetical protein